MHARRWTLQNLKKAMSSTNCGKNRRRSNVLLPSQLEFPLRNLSHLTSFALLIIYTLGTNKCTASSYNSLACAGVLCVGFCFSSLFLSPAGSSVQYAPFHCARGTVWLALFEFLCTRQTHSSSLCTACIRVSEWRKQAGAHRKMVKNALGVRWRIWALDA